MVDGKNKKNLTFTKSGSQDDFEIEDFVFNQFCFT